MIVAKVLARDRRNPQVPAARFTNTSFGAGTIISTTEADRLARPMELAMCAGGGQLAQYELVNVAPVSRSFKGTLSLGSMARAADDSGIVKRASRM